VQSLRRRQPASSMVLTKIHKQCHQLLCELTLAASGPGTGSQTEGHTPQNIAPENRNQLTQDQRRQIQSPKPSLKRSTQVQYNYNTTAIQEFFIVLQLYCTCADPRNTMLQYKFSTTCRLLAAVVKNLYCSCIALVLTVSK